MESKSILSNEEIARIFGLYIDCPYRFSNTGYKTDIVNKSSGDTFEAIWRNGIEDRRLLLTPLEDISDEHAIEVAEIVCHARVHHWVISRPHHLDYIEVIGSQKEGETYGGVVSISRNGILNWEWYNREKIDGYERQVFHAYQYLIQQGYAVPLFFGVNHWANGKTAIELNIAINKNNTTNGK